VSISALPPPAPSGPAVAAAAGAAHSASELMGNGGISFLVSHCTGARGEWRGTG
jgi:hypothetical protein